MAAPLEAHLLTIIWTRPSRWGLVVLLSSSLGHRLAAPLRLLKFKLRDMQHAGHGQACQPVAWQVLLCMFRVCPPAGIPAQVAWPACSWP